LPSLRVDNSTSGKITHYCFGANSGKMARSLKTTKWIYLFTLEKIGLQSLSPIFEIKIIASYSKMQEAHLYAKLKGEIYMLYIGISLV
jgi:hypothetical protein